MEIFNILPTLFASVAVLVAFFATYRSVKNLKYRLYIEKKLAHNLALSLKKRKIDSKVSVSLNEITVSGKCSEIEINSFKREIDSALKEAIEELVSSERQLVLRSIEQPSKQGQINYLKKLVENSLDELQHKQA